MRIARLKMGKDKNKKFYCRYCGNEMIVKPRPQEENAYDQKTGKPTGATWEHWKCPNKFWLFDKHDEWDTEPISMDFL